MGIPSHDGGYLACSLFCPLPCTLIIFQRLDDIILGFPSGTVEGNIRTQPFCLEADFLFLVWLFLTKNRFDDLRTPAFQLWRTL